MGGVRVSLLLAATLLPVWAMEAKAAPACKGLVASLKRVEGCHRPVLMRHLCSGMAPKEFETLVSKACLKVREEERPCLVSRYVAQGVSPKDARDGAEETLASAVALELDIYTARYDGSLKEPAFQCPRPAPKR